MSMVYVRISDTEVLRDYRSVLGPGEMIAGPGAEAIRAGKLSCSAIDWLKSALAKRLGRKTPSTQRVDSDKRLRVTLGFESSLMPQ